MTRNQKLLIGLAGAGVLAYLLFKGSKAKAQTTPTGNQNSTAEPSESGTYAVTQDIVYGYKPNTGGQPNIVFKKGDKVQGKIIERYIFNRNTKGIMAFPTVEGAYVETPDGKTFIEEIYLVKTAIERSPRRFCPEGQMPCPDDGGCFDPNVTYIRNPCDRSTFPAFKNIKPVFDSPQGPVPFGAEPMAQI